jgi:hypothetical protein
VDPAAARELDEAPDYTRLFRLVKRLVESRLGKSRAGIMLGLAGLGLSPEGFLGGYFVLGSNAIVLNRDVLRYVQATEPRYHNAYAFHVLLHEYLHTLGYYGEDEVRPLAHRISLEVLGPEHAATRIAAAMDPTVDAAQAGDAPAFFRQLVYPPFGWAPSRKPHIEIVKGFDPDATPYIA